jgi:uncharacterized membrane protein
MPFFIETAEEGRQASFAARVVPEESSGADGFSRVTLALLMALSLAEALVLRAGLWVAGGFLCGDAACIWLGLLVLRHRPPSIERIVIGEGELRLCRAGAADRRLRVFGLALERDDHPEHGCLGLWLRLRELKIEIARGLHPHERAAFGEHLETAIGEAGGRPRAERRLRSGLQPAAGEA